uniref:Uncharacterized protein n=1 Tax=Oryza nivara TaxID=4536 RepID=A0A0E0GT78_ORYNI
MERTYRFRLRMRKFKTSVNNVNGGGGSFFPFRAGGDPEQRGQPGVVSPRSGRLEGRRGRRPRAAWMAGQHGLR